MGRTTMEVVLSEELQQRIVAAAQSRGESTVEFIQDALFTYVEDIEDGVLSDVALTEEGLTYFSEERARQHAMDHPLLEAGGKTA